MLEKINTIFRKIVMLKHMIYKMESSTHPPLTRCPSKIVQPRCLAYSLSLSLPLSLSLSLSLSLFLSSSGVTN